MKKPELEIRSQGNNRLKVLGGIDSLYYYLDTQNDRLYQDFFEKTLNNEVQSIDFGRFKLNFAGKTSSKAGCFGGVWYKLDYHTEKSDEPISVARIGFKSDKIQRKVHNVFVQLDAYSIYALGLLRSIALVSECCAKFCENDKIFNVSEMPVNRIDVNAFVSGVDFSVYDNTDYFKSPFRAEGALGDFKEGAYIYKRNGSLESLYLGLKSGSWHFKIYDKMKEIAANSKGKRFAAANAKIAYLQEHKLLPKPLDMRNYGDYLVWNIEFTYKRQFLRECNLYTVENVLDNAKSLFLYGMERISLLDSDVESIKHAKKHDNLSRIDSHWIWQHIAEHYSREQSKELLRECKKQATCTVDGITKYFLWRLQAMGLSKNSVYEAIYRNL